MPSFTYSGDDERYYPDRGLLARPGDVVDLDDAPDALWSATPAKTTKTTDTATTGA